jgi:transcriptional regulator with XRE-family HTH domain
MSDISLLLKETRQKYGLTLEDVASRTYIKLPYLEALEEGRLDALPAPVYTYGYIRQYAKLLGLDGGELVAAFQAQELGPRPGPSTQRSLPPMPNHDPYPYRANGGGGNGGHGNGGTGHGNGHRGTDAGYPPAYAPSGGEAHEVQAARLQAQQILANAEREAQQMIQGAEQYAAQVLANLEVEVAKALQIIQNGRHYLNTRRQGGPNGH